jgi:hypothetical protein
MAISSYDVVNPLGGDPPGYSTVDQNAIQYDGGLFTPPHATLLNGGHMLRLGPSIDDVSDTTFYLAKAIPTGSTDSVDTSVIFAHSYIETSVKVYLLQRWAEGASTSGIRLGFGNDNSLYLDVNRALDGGFNNYALRMNFSGLTHNMFHGIRLSTRTIGQDVYMTAWAHLDLTNLNDLTWTKMFTVQHLTGTSTVQYAQHYSGGYFSDINVGSMNGLTVPCASGRSGIGIGVTSGTPGATGRLVYLKNFSAALG